MSRELDSYREKRNTNKTTEPEGIVEESSKQLKFVVQFHEARNDHYDFRLEWEGVLLSWAVPKGPSYDPRDKRLAVEVEAHPLDYRNFEGTIPKGEYGGGVVMLWDEGEWEPQGDVEKSLIDGSLKFILKGDRLKGKWALVRLKPDEKGNNKNWLLIKEKDQYARNDPGILSFSTSVRTDRTMKEIEEDKKVDQDLGNRNPFDKTGVQLAKLTDSVPDGKGWIYELKYDGYRILAYAEGKNVRLMTRNGKDYKSRFAGIAEAVTDWSNGRAMVLDGEVVVLDEDGSTDFQALQGYLKSPKSQKLTYIIFDLLALSGKDMRMEPLKERKKKLASLMENGHPVLHYSSHTGGEGKNIFVTACQAKREGIICKKEESIYSGTRNGDWLKVKCENRQEFVIGGYTRTDKRKSGISALLLGVYEGEDLIYVGRAGTGFTEKSMRDLESRFEKIRRKTPSFKEPPKQRTDETITWLRPQLVAEIRFSEWTDENQLRQASYKGLRMDKDPKEVKKESLTEENLKTAREVNSMAPDTLSLVKNLKKMNRKSIKVDGIRISSPDKEMFEGTGITKEDLARYYLTVADRMMVYAGNRILSFVRCPEGFPGECFYQKHLTKNVKGLRMVPITEKNGDKEDYFYIEEADGIITAVQMGTLEFHTWGSQVDQLETPDMMVFDLDPEEGMDLKKVREGVRDMKKVLDELSLTSFLKTSGGKGYHVVVPLEPSADWDTVKTFAKMTAMAMEERWPDRYTSNMRKDKRKGKIFVDWVRNSKSATSVAPYSVRARKGAPVSMPITWEELDTVDPNGIDIKAAIRKINEDDPWKDFFKTKQKLSHINSSV